MAVRKALATMNSEEKSLLVSIFKDNFMQKDSVLSNTLYKSLYQIVYDRYLYLHRHSTKERYLALIQRFPKLLETVTLKDIASYLLITPNHLSRLRKEISQENKT